MTPCLNIRQPTQCARRGGSKRLAVGRGAAHWITAAQEPAPNQSTCLGGIFHRDGDNPFGLRASELRLGAIAGLHDVVHCMASAIFSAAIRVGKLVLAHGTTGKIQASTTRKPCTPFTRPR